MGKNNLDDFVTVIEELNKESDRGVVLLAHAYLGELLGKVIEAFLVDHPASRELLSPSYQPMGTFSARLRIAFSLGLIGENEYKDMEIINSIRNYFAHSWKEANLNVQIVVQKIGTLSKADDPIVDRDSRFHFIMTIGRLVSNLTWRPDRVEKEKRKIRGKTDYPPVLTDPPNGK